MRRWLLWVALSVVALFGAVPVMAHVKWFNKLEPERVPIEQVLSPFFMVTALVLAVVLGLIPQLESRLAKVAWLTRLESRIEKGRRWTFLILVYGVAAAVVLQLLNGAIFAPEIEIAEIGFPGEIFLAVAIVVLLVTGWHVAIKVASLGLLLLWIQSVVHLGLFHMLDYGFYLAIVAALVLYKTPWEKFAMPLLYLGTGLSLCWVAAEKWIYPGMSLDIIERFAIPTFGFTATAFVVMAAFVEFVVGYLLVVGIFNRLLSIVVTLLFVTTTTVFGVTEVVGHFMIHVVLLIFIIEGVSFYRPPIKIHKSAVDQIVFVTLNFLFVLSMVLLLYYRFAG